MGRKFASMEEAPVKGEPESNGKISPALEKQMQPARRSRDEVIFLLGRNSILIDQLIQERNQFQAELAAYENEKKGVAS